MHTNGTGALSKGRWRRSVAVRILALLRPAQPERFRTSDFCLSFLFLFLPATPTLNSAEKGGAIAVAWDFHCALRSGEKAPLHAFSGLSDAAGFCRLTRRVSLRRPRPVGFKGLFEGQVVIAHVHGMLDRTVRCEARQGRDPSAQSAQSSKSKIDSDSCRGSS